jgi:hypothetical protein
MEHWFPFFCSQLRYGGLRRGSITMDTVGVAPIGYFIDDSERSRNSIIEKMFG